MKTSIKGINREREREISSRPARAQGEGVSVVGVRHIRTKGGRKQTARRTPSA